jgi:hypothetical protein
MGRAMFWMVAASFFAVGCTLQTPNTPSPNLLDRLAGTWVSTSSSSSGLANACSDVQYAIDKVSDTRATVRFSGTCAGITAAGDGEGILSGSVLTWSTHGTVSWNGQPACGFAFTNGTARLEGEAVKITYSGTICGLPVSGSQLLDRR